MVPMIRIVVVSWIFTALPMTVGRQKASQFKIEIKKEKKTDADQNRLRYRSMSWIPCLPGIAVVDPDEEDKIGRRSSG